MFAYLLGIRPWEIRHLTVAEFEDCVAFVDEWQKAQKRQR